MAKGLYIGATRPYSGKNLLTIGIGLRLQQQGLRIGYMKPVGTPSEKQPDSDDDALFVQQILGLEQKAELTTPVLFSQDMKMRAVSGKPVCDPDTVKTAYDRLAQDKDVMLVSGFGHMLAAKLYNLDGLRIVRDLGLQILIVDRLNQEVSYDFLLAYKEYLGESLLGVVLSDVPANLAHDMENIARPLLERNGIPLLGIIPHDPLLASVRAQDLVDSLGGKLVTAQDKPTGMVENFLIGTMQVENFMGYFRRHPNAAVIVGGDRADVQLVAIEGNCPCIVLTGNLYPNDIILSRAETLHVPIVIVREDTYTVARKMEKLLNRHKLQDREKADRAAELVRNNINFDLLQQKLL